LVGGVGFEGAVDDVGEAAFEDAEGFESAVALCFAACEQSLRVGVPLRLGEGDPVECGVELAVAGAAEPVSGSVRGPDG
jgi:hypothetical protein